MVGVVVVVVGVVVLVLEFQSTVAPLVLLKELLLEELKALWLLGESQALRPKVRIIKGISLFIFILMHLFGYLHPIIHYTCRRKLQNS